MNAGSAPGGDSQYLLDTAEHTATVYGGDVTRLLVFTTGIQPGQHVVRAAVAWMEPGKGGQTHYHPYTDEHYYVLDGVADVVINGVPHRLKPDSFIRVPRGSTHSMGNGGEQTLRYLAFHVADLAFTGEVEHVEAQ